MTWVLVMAASLASGTLGALVTTYGNRTKERREARAKVHACFQKVEQLARHPDPAQEYYRVLLSALEGASLVAAVPFRLVRFYRRVRLQAYATHFTTPPGECDQPRAHWLVAARVADKAAALLAASLWHPWLSAPVRRWHLRRLQRILDAGLPDHAQQRQLTSRTLQEWERDLLRRPNPSTAEGPGSPISR